METIRDTKPGRNIPLNMSRGERRDPCSDHLERSGNQLNLEDTGNPSVSSPTPRRTPWNRRRSPKESGQGQHYRGYQGLMAWRPHRSLATTAEDYVCVIIRDLRHPKFDISAPS